MSRLKRQKEISETDLGQNEEKEKNTWKKKERQLDREREEGRFTETERANPLSWLNSCQWEWSKHLYDAVALSPSWPWYDQAIGHEGWVPTEKKKKNIISADARLRKKEDLRGFQK